MVEIEDYFPRGGKKPLVTNFKQAANFLGNSDKRDKKKRKIKKKSDGENVYSSDDDTNHLYKTTKRDHIITLSYKSIKVGLLILGRVQHVLDTKVTVMLPNRMLGTIMACHVTEPYNKLLEAYVNDKTDKVKELAQMFHVGQYIAVKVLEVEERNVMLSTMPQHVNYGKKHSDLYKGALFHVAVVSIEDHGYLMDLGIPNTRAFLPTDEANSLIQLDVGMVVWCSVKSAKVASDSCIVTLSSKLSSLQSGEVKRKPVTTLLPATALHFTVETPLDQGIKGHVFGDMRAYILRQHIDTSKGKRPTIGQKVKARVLYTMPTSGAIFLTTKDVFATTFPDMDQEQKLQVGDIVDEAQVLRITGRAVHFKLGQESFGTMSLKRIQIDEELTDEEVVAKSYPIGSRHSVRVLCYDMSDYLYSVSDEPSVLTEKYFKMAEVQPGDLLEATVHSHQDGKLILKVGRLRGIVPRTHLTDAGLYVDPKKGTTSDLAKNKFKVGQKVLARALSVEPDRRGLVLTLKPSLVASDLDPLCTYEQAVLGNTYVGTIKAVREFLLVSFFGGVSAYVSAKHAADPAPECLNNAFHLGQVVNCTIWRIDLEARRLWGSLLTNVSHKKHEHGEKFKFDVDDEHAIAKEKKNKNKHNNQEVQSKENTDGANKKKKSEQGVNINNENMATKNNKKRKKLSDDSTTEGSTEKKKVKNMKEVENSEETDHMNNRDEVLTPQEMGLIDLSDCVNEKQIKKRVVSLLKAINSRSRRITVINKKISNIEEKGLTAKNKKFHTAMHAEKLIIEERMTQLTEALKTAQVMLNEFAVVVKKGPKNKTKDGIEKGNVVGINMEEEIRKKTNKEEKHNKKEKKESNEKCKKIENISRLLPALDVPNAKEMWSTAITAIAPESDHSSTSDDEDQDEPKKKRKKLTASEKVCRARAEEERVRTLERVATESEHEPRSAEQFERALIATPNASQLWIAYMAFHLQATEVERARGVARRALSTISFREEQEKLNVWLALLNLETRFGTKESQQKILEEAVRANEPYDVHSALLDMYAETGKHQELSSLVDLMLKKYKREARCYVACGAACYRLGTIEKARRIMQKAVAVLDKKQHISVLVQFALLERRSGEVERSETLLEQIIGVYPQRVDVCSTYTDMIANDNDINRIRQVMERMTSHKLPARKMKILYKKWADMEQKMGDEDHLQMIRDRAKQYVERAQF